VDGAEASVDRGKERKGKERKGKEKKRKGKWTTFVDLMEW
jgi:hypothetical protein